jgi:4-amino-4-deoxy-L-arabinose transferase-like glycosyltransferase
MDRLFQKPIIAVSTLILICSYLFFLQLGKLALTDPDETFYAESAKEMLAGGEWITPHLYGKPQFEKPILFYWLVEASFKTFGVNEFAARFPSAVLGTIGVIAIFFLGSLLFNRRAGFLSALILATNVEYIILSRACITDMTLFVFMLLAALFFSYGYIKEKGYFYLLSSASIALATLTKGPVYFVLFAAAILAFLFFTKDLKALKRMPLWQAALVFLAVSMPWYIAIYRLHGKTFIDSFFGFQNVTRFLVSEHKTGSQIYYNIPIILGGMFPWSIFLPAGFWHICKKIREKKASSVFLIVLFFVIFGFFTISSTKLPTYIFPCFISLAIIIGVLLDDFLNGKVSGPAAKTTRISYYVLIVIMLLGWAGAAVYAKLDFPSIMAGVIISGLVLAIGGLISLIAFMNKRFALAFVMIALSVAIFLCPLSVLILPEVERYESSKEVSAKLLAIMKPGEELGAASNYVPGLAFYTGKFPVDLDWHHAQINLMNSGKRIWAVIKEKNHKQIYDPEITKEYVKPSYVIFSVGKRSIITNEVPSDGHFLVKRERPQ